MKEARLRARADRAATVVLCLAVLGSRAEAQTVDNAPNACS
jgi:hypothetical protein